MALLELYGNRISYNPKLKERTKELRKNMTEPEKRLWFGYLKELQKLPPTPSSEGEEKDNPPRMRGKSEAKGELFRNQSFRVYRQRPIDNFIVDFYIPKYKLVIEIDGESHFTQEGLTYDIERTAVLKGLGLQIIRFTNEEIMNNFNGVCETLENIFSQ